MISRSRIEDWIRQVEAAPAAAPAILRLITERMIELDETNEKLRIENLSLSSGERVKEYQKTIADLEFQLDLLKRQVGSGSQETSPGSSSSGLPQPSAPALPDLLLFNEKGQVLRFALNPADLKHGALVSKLNGSPVGEGNYFELLAVRPSDQLLFIYSSGRTVTRPVEQILAVDNRQVAWQGAHLEEPRPLEELVAVIPVTRMTWFDQCIQISRFSYAKQFDMKYFKNFISNNNVGRGTKLHYDRLFNLTLCRREDLYVVATRSGSVMSTVASSAPLLLEEIIHFKVGDYVVAAFTQGEEQSLVAVSTDGLVYSQPPPGKVTTLEGSKASLDRRLRSIFPPRQAGNERTLAGAAAAGAADWGILFREDGTLTAFQVSQATAKGAAAGGDRSTRVLAFTCFSPGP